jgi:hypothetical protein
MSLISYGYHNYEMFLHCKQKKILLYSKYFWIGGVSKISYLGSKPAFLSQSASGGTVVVEGVAVVVAMVVVAMVGGKVLMVAAVVVVDGGHLGSLLIPDKKKFI